MTRRELLKTCGAISAVFTPTLVLAQSRNQTRAKAKTQTVTLAVSGMI